MKDKNLFEGKFQISIPVLDYHNEDLTENYVVRVEAALAKRRYNNLDVATWVFSNKERLCSNYVYKIRFRILVHEVHEKIEIC